MNLRNVDAWNHLDSITTHPAGSRLQQVVINICFFFRYFDYGVELDADRVEKAVLEGLPSLLTKGIIVFVKSHSASEDSCYASGDGQR